MSSDRQRLVGAIRRIAGIDTDDGERASSSANRGSQPAAVGQGITESSDRLCCDGSVSSNPNPGTETRDSSDGTGGLDGSDPADISGMGGGCLSGVTDCATGEPICFCGEGFIPPDGWADPSTPPIPDEWVADDQFYWGGPDGRPLFRTKGQTKEYLKGAGVGERTKFCTFQIDDEDVVRATYDFPDGIGSCNGFIQYSRRDCALVPNETWCGTDHGNPTPDEIQYPDWPTDSCVNLAVIGGKIVGSKYDPENDGSYSAPRDEIELCDGSNGSILIRGSAGGGWKSIASLSGDIDPDTDHGYLYSAYGDTIRQISPSEFRDDRV